MKAFINLTVALCFSLALTAQVGIGTTTPLAALHIEANNNGLLIPRVALTSTTDATTIITATESELVYNTTAASGTTDVSPGFYYLSSPTGPWVRLGDGSSGPPPPPPPPTATGWSLTGNAATAGDFLGTTTNVDLVFKREGFDAGKIGASNTSFGLAAGEAVGGGDANTAVGVNALKGNVGSDNNTAIGFDALQASTGANNTALGFNASRDNTSGSGNTGIGAGTLRLVAQGDNNTAIGLNAGNSISQGNRNIVIGFDADVIDPVGNEQLSIGANWIYRNTVGNLGINTNVPTATLSVNGTADKPGSATWIISSDRRSKENIETYTRGLNELMKINPIKFNYKKEFGWGTKTYVGLIAQDIQKVVPSMVTEKEVNGIKDFRKVDPNELTYILINSIKEQQVIIDKVKKDNADLKATNAAILKRLEALENK